MRPRGDRPIAASTVVCWDIDGTLLTTGGAGKRAWADAVEELLAREISVEEYRTAGLTDVEISRLLAGILSRREASGTAPEASPELLANRLLEGYERCLSSRLRRHAGEVLTGVTAILGECGRRPDVLCTLLTGNTRAGARAKLGHYGLLEHFEVGAFADGTWPESDGPSAASLAPDRATIARSAVEIASSRARFPADRVFVVGDTPHDIGCGREIGAKTVAVATGDYSVDELVEHDPWWVLDRLPDAATFLARLDGPGP